MPEVVDKRTAILNTTLSLLVARGFAATPMADIARHAGVSAGIIYHYFDSKETLINELYCEIKTACTIAVFGDDTLGGDGRDVLRCLWLNAFTYYVKHPQETLFLEQYENWPGAITFDPNFHPASRAMFERLQQDIAAGVYVDLPFGVLYELTFAVALSLAKAQIDGRIKLDSAQLDATADAVCRAVAPR